MPDKPIDRPLVGDAIPTVSKKNERVSASGKKVSSGSVVVLKAICQELKVEPRKARAILRKAKKAGKLPREADGARWQWAPDEADAVRALLKK